MITNFKIYENFGIMMDTEKSEIGVKVLHILSQVQIFHWQAQKMGHHNVFDEFADDFKEMADNLLEVIQGKYGRINLDQGTYIPVRNEIELSPYQFADQCAEVFRMYQNNIFKEDQEIVALIDEVVALFEKLKYLLTFN